MRDREQPDTAGVEPTWKPLYTYATQPAENGEEEQVLRLLQQMVRLPAVACECFTLIGPGIWFLLPEVPENLTMISEEGAAELVGAAALERPGEATAPVFDTRVPMSSPRARWLVEAIRTTQEWIGGCVEDNRVERFFTRPGTWDWQYNDDQFNEVLHAYRTLYRLWDEMRVIQAHFMRRDRMSFED